MSILNQVAKQLKTEFMFKSTETGNKLLFEATKSSRYGNHNVRLILKSEKKYIGFITNGIFTKVNDHFGARFLEWYLRHENSDSLPIHVKAFVYAEENNSSLFDYLAL